MKKKITSLALLTSVIVLFMAISSVRATTWVEVVRWSGSAFPDPEQFTTEPFNCPHVDWRIRWSYTAVGSPFESLLMIEIFEGGESIGLIYKSGYFSRSGDKYIYNNSGTFYLEILLLNMDDYTIIVEQDIDSIPEFTPVALIIVFITVSTLAVVLSKRKRR